MPLTAWENFYVIVGSSAAALTGLQFVVIALVAGSRTRPTAPGEISAFASPTVVHFSAALFICATLSAPWESLLGASAAVVAGGLAGVTYAIVVARRTRRQTRYKPVVEDWIWHVILPLVAYIAILAAGIVLHLAPVPSLFVIGAATLLLVYIGIHNAWDAVIFITLQEMPPSDDTAGKH